LNCRILPPIPHGGERISAIRRKPEHADERRPQVASAPHVEKGWFGFCKTKYKSEESAQVVCFCMMNVFRCSRYLLALIVLLLSASASCFITKEGASIIRLRGSGVRSEALAEKEKKSMKINPQKSFMLFAAEMHKPEVLSAVLSELRGISPSEKSA
jgi:hypothetical protein